MTTKILGVNVLFHTVRLQVLNRVMTIIVIAHRLSTIRNADQVIVLDEGQVVQNGRFGTLSQEKKSTFGDE